MFRRKFKPNPDFPRQGQRWTDEERDDLFKEVHEMSIEDISKIHQRTTSGIIAQIGARVAKLIADGMDEQEACESMNFSTENYKKYCEIQEKYNKAKTESAMRYVKQSEYQQFKEWQAQRSRTNDEESRPSSSSDNKTVFISPPKYQPRQNDQQPKYQTSKYNDQPPRYQPRQNEPPRYQPRQNEPPKYNDEPPKYQPRQNEPPKYQPRQNDQRPTYQPRPEPKPQDTTRPWTAKEQAQFVRDMKEQYTMGDLAKKYKRSVGDLHGQLLTIMMSKR